MVKVREDLTGKFFGKLKVLHQVDDWITPKGQHEAQWLCQCTCCSKTEKIIRGRNLKNGSIRSCGCLIKETYYKAEIDDEGNFKKKRNDYEIQEDYVILYTQRNEIILVDLEDFWKVKDMCWSIGFEGYAQSEFNNKRVLMHRLIMDEPIGKLVDHKNGENSRYDNRKSNLRIATHSQNQINKKKLPNKYSDVTGVSWAKQSKKWVAYIGVSGKQVKLGYFDSFDDAVSARKKAEKKYYGEWSYDKSQQINTWSV